MSFLVPLTFLTDRFSEQELKLETRLVDIQKIKKKQAKKSRFCGDGPFLTLYIAKSARCLYKPLSMS
jgi:hypothetical protein